MPQRTGGFGRFAIRSHDAGAAVGEDVADVPYPTDARLGIDELVKDGLMKDVVKGLFHVNPDNVAKLSSTGVGIRLLLKPEGDILSADVPAESEEGIRKVIM